MRLSVVLPLTTRCTLVVAALATALVSAADPLADLARLGGSWVRNGHLSDDPDEAAKEHPRHPPFIGPGAPVGPLGGPGMGGPLIGGRGGYTRSDPAEVERTRALMHLATDLPDQMTISIDGTAVTITSRSGRVLHLRADGRKKVEVSDVGLELERKTKWDDGALVTEFKAKGGGGEGKHEYKRDGARLVVRVTFDGDAAMRTVKMKQVYEVE